MDHQQAFHLHNWYTSITRKAFNDAFSSNYSHMNLHLIFHRRPRLTHGLSPIHFQQRNAYHQETEKNPGPRLLHLLSFKRPPWLSFRINSSQSHKWVSSRTSYLSCSLSLVSCTAVLVCELFLLGIVQYVLERKDWALVQWVINYVPLCVFSSSSQHHAFPVSQQVVDGGNEVSSDLPDSWGKFAHQFHLEKERGVASLTADDNQQWRYEPHQKQCGKICALLGEKKVEDKWNEVLWIKEI